MSGRKSAHAAESWDMSSRARSESVPWPCMTWTKPAVSGVADDIGDDVGAVLEGGLGAEQPGGLGPPAVLLGTAAVAAGGFLGLEAGQGDEAAVIGDPGGRAEPSGGAGCQVARPLVERGVGPLSVRDLSLDDLNEHLDPPWREPARWPRQYRERRTWVGGAAPSRW